MARRARAVVIAALTTAALGAPAVAHDRVWKGEAIYYSNELAGETMACGGKYRPRKMVAAHRKLPCGTTIRVKNRANGRVVRLTVKDRGPFGDKKRSSTSRAGRRASCGSSPTAGRRSV